LRPNPNCDKGKCLSPNGEVRLLPYPNGNLILCRHCFEDEIRWRLQRNWELAEWAAYAIPAWEGLEAYPAGDPSDKMDG
jgi:hypothetical protein